MDKEVERIRTQADQILNQRYDFRKKQLAKLVVEHGTPKDLAEKIGMTPTSPRFQ